MFPSGPSWGRILRAEEPSRRSKGHHQELRGNLFSSTIKDIIVTRRPQNLYFVNELKYLKLTTHSLRSDESPMNIKKKTRIKNVSVFGRNDRILCDEMMLQGVPESVRRLGHA